MGISQRILTHASLAGLALAHPLAASIRQYTHLQHAAQILIQRLKLLFDCRANLSLLSQVDLVHNDYMLFKESFNHQIHVLRLVLLLKIRKIS